MRMDDQLQPKVVSTLYLLGAVVMLLLSVQNYRYGLYPLVYSASLIMMVLAGLGLYARFTDEETRLGNIGLWGLGICLLITASESLSHANEVKHWVYPLVLLCFVALKHQGAMILSSVSLGILSLSLLFQQDMLSTLSFASSLCLLIALASTYAKLQQQRNRTLVELEIREPLTRAYNFRYLEETLGKEICRADRTGKALSLVALEIDYFPQIIDVHGTSTSADLSRQLTESLRSMIRAGDSLYFDGEQIFYLLLPCTPSDGVVVIAERIRRAIEQSQWPVVDSITVSLGCTSYLSGAKESDANSLVNDTHIALIEAQKNGHNRVCHH